MHRLKFLVIQSSCGFVLALVLLFQAVPGLAQGSAALEGIYVVENGQPVGPLSAEDVNQRVRDLRIVSDSLVWKSGMPDWVAAGTVPELAQAIGMAAQSRTPPRMSVQDFGTYLAGTWESEPARTEIPDVGTVDVVNTITFAQDGLFESLTRMNSVPGSAQPMTLNVAGKGTYTLSGATPTSVRVSFLGTSLTTVEGDAGAGYPDQLQFDTTVEVVGPSEFFEDGSTYRRVSQ